MSFDAWNAFRKNESFMLPPPVCCVCHGPAQGNVSFEETGEEVCDKCNEEMIEEIDD